MILSRHDSVGLPFGCGLAALRPSRLCGLIASPRILLEMHDSRVLQCEERREKGEGARARTHHFAVTDLQVTPVGLSLRSSRLCGLMGLGSNAWLRL